MKKRPPSSSAQGIVLALFEGVDGGDQRIRLVSTRHIALQHEEAVLVVTACLRLGDDAVTADGARSR